MTNNSSSNSNVTVVDYGLGNTGAIINMIGHIGGIAHAESDPDKIAEAEKIVLPGVGAFDAGMTALNHTGMDNAVIAAVQANSTPFLGICLGMQLLLESSEEGSLDGLSMVPGRARRFQPEDPSLRVPHMGWNEMRVVRDSALFSDATDEPRFYFVHSYYVECDDPADVIGVTSYGHEYVSAYQHGNIFGVQFHAEKSHRHGMDLFRRFLAI